MVAVFFIKNKPVIPITLKIGFTPYHTNGTRSTKRVYMRSRERSIHAVKILFHLSWTKPYVKYLHLAPENPPKKLLKN